MDNFLYTTKKWVTNLSQNMSSLPIQDNIHIILGNEAVDLDSVVSSLVYAYFLQNVQEISDCHVIPVLNCTRKDFILRTDVVFTLKKTSVNQDSLVFIDDIDLKVLKDRGILRGLTMVDHNILAPEQEFMNDIIVKIIDHHKDEQNHVVESRKYIEPVGSCCTLVAEHIIKNIPLLLTTQIAKLLVTTILLDTYSLPDMEDRSTKKDKFCIKELSKGLDKESLELYKSVKRAKFDNSCLGSYDLLRKDFKYLTKGQLHDIGISSVTSNIYDLTARENFERDVIFFCQEMSVSVLVIMCIEVITEVSSVTRQLAVWSQNTPHLADHIAKHLLDQKELKLEPAHLPNCSSLTCFQQGNLSASRKIISPILKSILLII